MKFPLRALVVEDQKEHADMLIKRLKQDYDAIIDQDGIKVALSYEQALSLLEEQEYDVSFLDIDLGGHTCFDLFEKIDIYSLGIVVYLTSSEIYTNENLAQINPHFFAAKPVSKPSLDRLFDQLAEYLNKLKAIDSRKLSFLFWDVKGWVTVFPEEIFYAKSSSNHSIIYYIKDAVPAKVTVRKTLKALSKMFSGYDFWRVQKRFLVNNEHVKMYEPIDSTRGEVIFKGDIKFSKLDEDALSGDRPAYTMDFLGKYSIQRVK